MTGTYLDFQNAENYTPPTLPMKKQVMTMDGCKVTINFSDNSDKAAVGEVKRIILDGLAKSS